MLIPIVVLEVFFGYILIRDQIRTQKASCTAIMEKNAQQLDKILIQAMQICQTVGDDREILKALANVQNSNSEYGQEIEISNELMKKASYFDDNIQVYIFDQKGNKYKSSSLSFKEAEIDQDNWTLMASESSDMAWIELYEESKVVDTFREHFISVVDPIRDHSTGEVLGVILVETCVDQILYQENNWNGITFLYNTGTYNKLKIENGLVKKYEDETITLIDAERGSEELSIAQKCVKGIAYWENDFPDKNLVHYKEYELCYQKLNVNNWILVNAIPDQEFFHTLYISIAVFAVLTTVLLVVVFFISRGIAEYVTRPILELKDNVETLQKGQFDIEVSKITDDEIGELSIQFNKMVTDIHHLMDEIVEEQEIRRGYELMLLNAQINPHFLYNTLDSLMWLIRMKKLDDAELMLQSLTNFFKTGLNKGNDIISLKEEIENVSSYLAIQKLRYRSKLEYEIYLEPEAEKILLPKLILQPLVENAIYHGIKPKEQGGMIFVWCFLQEGELILRVKDNGIGMDETTLQHLKDDFKEKKPEMRESYGVINVDERLRLFFKERYSMKIESKTNMGTELTIKIEMGNDTCTS
ncbi:MAG: sensor histidine kinase [Muricoprocola sp.]